MPAVAWLGPAPGSDAGWKTTVSLRSDAATENVTLLVRPRLGTTFYVQPGARPLPAGVSESFEVQLGGERRTAIGTEFDIIAVCSNGFGPSKWSLSMSEVPYSAVIGRATVRKVAGTIYLVGEGLQGQMRVHGEIATPDGGALLARDGRGFAVLRAFEPSPAGNQFDETLPADDGNAIYLAVCKKRAPVPAVGQALQDIPAERYWLYGPAKEESQRPLEQGDNE